jgi:hypothetical protein
MATINSVTFNAGSGGVVGTYATGDTIDATMDFTPDTPAVVPQTFTLTTTVSDSTGAVTATNSSDFVVNTTMPDGDTVAASDTGSRTWTAGAQTPDGSGGLDVTFSATA